MAVKKYMSLLRLADYDSKLKEFIKSTYVSLSQKGKANGIATLDENEKIPRSQLPDNIEKYSNSEEIIVGTWIDGRDIYRKTIVYESGQINTGTNNGWAYYREISPLNIDQYINVRGMALCFSDKATATALWQPIPRICPDACETYSIGMGDLKSDAIGVLFGSGYTSATIYFTLEYVKNE